MYPGFPRQSGFETDSASHVNEWAALLQQARAAPLSPLPTFAEAVAGERIGLLRDLGYTFWNQELIESLTVRLAAAGLDRWLELAAGTGRLSAELARRGIDVAATDDYSQAPDRVRGSQRAIRYEGWVAPLSAREAMARFQPPGVLCAWPPLGSCLVPDLLGGGIPGAEALALLVCIGDPAGATEAPRHPHELPPGWTLETWPDCEQYLTGFNDPSNSPGSNSRLLIYRRCL
ncbi:MAG: SAM-dependent methyltransferase [Armatimonadetes bacterium]|nr:SAM-dependent methyltransferase [Armatimonadota bacterium]